MATALRPVSPSAGLDMELQEVYRQVFVSLGLSLDEKPITIGITSAISGEGRTTLAHGLAHTLSLDLDVPVTLVEVDLERPSLAPVYGITPAPGLSEVLREEFRLDEVLRAVADNLSIVTTGAVGPDSARLLRQLPLRDPFHTPQTPHGVLILDLPPIINHSYSPLAASVADAIVLVVRAGVTPIEVVREAIARLEDRPPRGVVFNGPVSALPRWWPQRTV